MDLNLLLDDTLGSYRDKLASSLKLNESLNQKLFFAKSKNRMFPSVFPLYPFMHVADFTRIWRIKTKC